ncbi:MAG: SGNH/GDSL hydrolase family protein [Clostridia bacterium]|nr:SGNH/GDSL hydrolase family protein [Clostridia bacterium]
MKAAIFGDSIMRGMYWDEEAAKYQIWHNDFLGDIEAAGGFELVNHALVGSTVERGRANFDKVVAKGLDCQLLLLEYGGNDCDFDWAGIAEQADREHQPKTPLQAFEKAYAGLITKARSLHMKPVLMTLPPIDAHKYFAWFSRKLNPEPLLHWLGDINIIYRHQELYSLAVARLAAAFSCPLIDLRSAYLPQHKLDGLIGVDGIHPTPAGYQLIWGEILRFFQQKPGSQPA